jgi:hypothetical protein
VCVCIKCGGFIVVKYRRIGKVGALCEYKDDTGMGFSKTIPVTVQALGLDSDIVSCFFIYNKRNE